MLREVALSFEGTEKTYKVDKDTHYSARVTALEMFLDEFKIQGRPVDYISGRLKGLISITVRSAVDNRTGERNTEPDSAFLLDQTNRLRRHVRTSPSLSEDRKSTATQLILQLEEVFSG